MLAFILSVLATLIVYRLFEANFVNSRKRRLRVLSSISLIAFLSTGLILVARDRFVRTIERPGLDDITVVVGSERTEFARNTFGDASDWDMLRKRGLNEEEIRKLWTFRSVMAGRLALLGSYLLLLIAVVVACSLAVLYEVMGPATLP